jgi:gluconolactonase
MKIVATCIRQAGAILMAASIMAPHAALAQGGSFVAPGATPQAIPFDLGGSAAGGPSVDLAGNVYFSLTNLGPKTGTIQKWTWADGKVTKVRDVDGAAIGTMVDTKRRLLVGEWRAARVTADDLQGHITVLADAIDGRRLVDPNAIAVDRSGAIYFTESGGAGDPGGIDYISPDGKTIRRAAPLAGARKLIISPDGKALIASGAGAKLWKLTVGAEGVLTDQQEFCTQQCANPVGFDEHGNVYMASDKLYVYSLKGDQLAVVDLPTRFSNGVFAGKDRRTLFLTGHDAVYTLQMAVKGAPTALDLVQGR